VWPDNLEAVELFLALQTQWRVSGTMAGIFYSGLDYGAAAVLLRARRSSNRAQLLADLQVMEFAALKGLNRRD
jgi:hypothetical protein